MHTNLEKLSARNAAPDAPAWYSAAAVSRAHSFRDAEPRPAGRAEITVGGVVLFAFGDLGIGAAAG